ncbi:MAG: hypothetical protein E7211_20700 [Clostridium lundense]|nr:hypothetical protein [Clostridium lundense]
MQICYIPSTSVTTVCSMNPVDWVGSGADWLGETIECAVSSAINNCIVRPFQNWCIDVWHWTVDASLPVCTTVSLISLMLYMIGVKNARKWIIIPIIIYLFIQIANGMI